MSFFIPAVAGGAFWLFAAYTYNLKQKLNAPSVMPIGCEEHEPFYGPVGHVKDWWFVDTRGRFKSMQQDVDELGADFFWVDYGNGQKVKQYNDPRILL